MRFLAILYISFLSLSAVGQISFFRLYSNNGSDRGEGVMQHADSSYVITGASSSFANEAAQAFLLKVDSMGNYIWSNHYGGPENDAGRRVLYQDGFGYYVCGYTNSFGAGGYDYYLIKVDDLGNKVWDKTYGDFGWEKVHDAALTRDTGVIMVGESSSTINDNKDMYLVRTDKNGDTIWTKQYGTDGDDLITSIERYSDTTYVIAGQKYIQDSAFVKAYVAFMHEDGSLYWETTSGPLGDYWFNDICFESGKIVAVGGTNHPTKDSVDMVFYHCDMAGGPLGLLEIPNPGNHEIQLITTYGAGDFYVPYTTEDAGSFPVGTDLQVPKYFTNFAWANAFSINHPDTDFPGQIIPTSDGGAILTGYTTGLVSGGNEVFLAKIGPNDLFPSISSAIIDEILFVNELDEVKEVKVYPNPSNTLVNITTDIDAFTSVRLMNTAGQLVYEGDFQLKQQIETTSFENGWYVLELSGANVTPLHKKLLIQH